MKKGTKIYTIFLRKFKSNKSNGSYFILNIHFTIDFIISKEYKDFTKAFANEKTDLSSDHYPIKHWIDLQNNFIPSLKPVYISFNKKLSVLHGYLNEYQKKEWIYKSISFVRVFIIFVFKKDNGYHFYIDYRNLNEITKKYNIAVIDQ